MYSLIYVDDDIDDLEVAQLAFEAIKWTNRVLLLDSGKKLLDYLDQLKHPLDFPCLLMLDYNLGSMNTEDVLVFLRSDSRYKSLRVAVLTSGLPSGTKDRLHELGAACCVDKPGRLESYTELASGLKHIAGEISSGIEPSFALLGIREPEE